MKIVENIVEGVSLKDVIRRFLVLDMVFRRSCTLLECAEVPAVNLTRTTYVAGWSPTSDDVTFSLAPEELGADPANNIHP